MPRVSNSRPFWAVARRYLGQPRTGGPGRGVACVVLALACMALVAAAQDLQQQVLWPFAALRSEPFQGSIQFSGIAHSRAEGTNRRSHPHVLLSILSLSPGRLRHERWNANDRCWSRASPWFRCPNAESAEQPTGGDRIISSVRRRSWQPQSSRRCAAFYECRGETAGGRPGQP